MLTTNRISSIKGDITVPGDKSVSHRSVMLAALGNGKSVIKGFLPGEDCLSTISCFRKLGISIEQENDTVIVNGKGMRGLREAEDVLDAGNSGTTMRLMSGILAGQDFMSVITGDGSLRSRPMTRVVEPLTQMGAVILGRENSRKAPLVISGRRLHGIEYKLPVASAQVKSAVLLAGLYADGETTVYEATASRDHTERMLKYLEADIRHSARGIEIRSSQLTAKDIIVPGDISSAAFFITAAAAIPGSELIVRNVGFNPTRTGIIDVLKEMGAQIEIENLRELCGEPVADIAVKGTRLHGIQIGGEIIPRLIDEIPIIAVAAAAAEGKTTITGAGELKFKETNRIAVLVSELGKLGMQVAELEDGLEVIGSGNNAGGKVESCGDHRIAMSMAICGLFADGQVTVNDSECIDISFPGFEGLLRKICF